jgi:uncharacterized protein YbgA (DUF1722 family)
MAKEGMADVSRVEINLETRYEYNEFNRIYIQACINGSLAEENSLFAKSFIDYWKKNKLLIMNNVILEEEKGLKYLWGSIKAIAVKALISKYSRAGEAIFDKDFAQINQVLKKKIGEAGLKELRETFLAYGRRSLPLKIIEED